MRTITKIRRSIRAISPVISVLLMIAIAVAASLVAYAWVMGYMGFTTNKVNKAIMIQSTASHAGKMDVYVQNVGQSPVTLDPSGSVYVNDELQTLPLPIEGGTTADGKTTLNPGETATIHTGYDWAENLKTRVVTTDGTSTEKNGNVGGANTAGSSMTSVQLSASSVSVGDSVVVTGTVTPSEATGSILFQYSTSGGSAWSDLGSPKTLSSGEATSDSYTATSVGTVYFRAIYTGDANYLGSQSGDTAEALTVGIATPGVSAPQLNPSSPIILGDSVSAIVTVSGSAGTPTGTVTFQFSSDGGSNWNTLGAVKDLSGGSATSDLYVPSAVGSNYRIRAVYSGDSNYNGATGAAASLTANKANPNVPAPTLNPASPITYGSSVTASVTITGVSGITPTGTVTFQVSTNGGTNYNTLGAVKTLASGSATSDSYTPPSSGNNYRFRAVYSGDTNYNGLTGSAASLTVNPNQVTFVGAGAGNGGEQESGNNDPDPTYPSGLQLNDLILLQVTVRDTSTTPDTPSGFTLLYGPDTTTVGRQWIYYKFSTGSESGTLTISVSGSSPGTARIYAFRNVALTSFTESASFGYNSNSQTINAQSVTTTGAKRLAVSFVYVTNDFSVGSFTGESGGYDWTEAVSEFTWNPDGSSNDACIQLQTATMASQGTISGGSYNMGSGNDDSWGVRAFALIPR